MRALAHDSLLQRIVTEVRRKNQAYAELSTDTDPTHGFTGTRFSQRLAEAHSRSEAALHRWDITGDDDISTQLLTQPELSAHATLVLNNMHSLTEPAHAIGSSARVRERTDIAFRVAHQPTSYSHWPRG